MYDVRLTLFRHRKSGDCALQRYAGAWGVGDFVNISAAEMLDQGADIVLHHLTAKPPTRDEKVGLALSKEEERAFRKHRPSVSINLRGIGLMEIGFLRRSGSGYVVRNDDIVSLPLPCANAEFLAALEDAFNK